MIHKLLNLTSRVTIANMWKLLFISLSVMYIGECSPRDKLHRRWTPNDIVTLTPHHSGPPDHNKLVAMARYVLHNCDWASIASISVLPAIEGFPFSNVKSVVDGSMANSTGIPYFYMSPLDFTARDLSKNSRATVLVSLEETRYCENQKYDPEDPRCTRLMLSGKMKKVKEGTPEYLFAKAALFERHPAMANFPPDHAWFIAKMKIAQIAMVDWFGGAKYVPVKDYLAYNYTGTEMLDYHNRNHYNLDEA
ncbi:protein CREG1 isoform X1 [Pararge aegeria]|uniref:protein CREG1 isoform X1 n=2 Tax=Pararge aegeria TaxID=116150 RepID=UPI0019D2E99E|nr:protein CREG1 isoform X1 [Pararge aegeria]